jgi:hypothetical protein
MCTECWAEYLTGGEPDLSLVVKTTDLKEMEWEGVEWNYLPQDRGQL